MSGSNPEALWDALSTAEYLGVSLPTLKRMRRDGRGPTYRRIGRLVKYRRADIDHWLDEQAVRTIHDQQAQDQLADQPPAPWKLG